MKTRRFTRFTVFVLIGLVANMLAFLPFLPLTTATANAPTAIGKTTNSLAVSYNNARHIVRDSNGYLYYAFLNGTTSNVYVMNSTNSGVTWGAAVLISTAAGMSTHAQNYPCIAVDSNNYLHVVWEGEATGQTSVYAIWYTNYTGSSWATPIIISNATGMSSNGAKWMGIKHGVQNQISTL